MSVDVDPRARQIALKAMDRILELAAMPSVMHRIAAAAICSDLEDHITALLKSELGATK